MGFFDEPMFDFNGDGVMEGDELMIGMQMMASSRKEAIELTGDDTFYMGDDTLEDDEDDRDDDDNDHDSYQDEIEDLMIDLEDMEPWERREAIEDAGFDPEDFDFD